MIKQKLSVKICPSCNNNFKPRNYKSKFCSKRCQWDAKKLKQEDLLIKIKKCNNCKKHLKIKNFYKCKKSRRGLQSWCIKCTKSRIRVKRILYYTCIDCKKSIQYTVTDKTKIRSENRRCFPCSRKKRTLDSDNKGPYNTGTGYFTSRLYSSWKGSAKRRNHDWLINKEDLDKKYKQQNMRCALSGIEMELKHKSLTRPSLDRIDSNKGYTKDNIQFVCVAINIMKNKFSESFFIDMCNRISDFNKLQ